MATLRDFQLKRLGESLKFLMDRFQLAKGPGNETELESRKPEVDADADGSRAEQSEVCWQKPSWKHKSMLPLLLTQPLIPANCSPAVIGFIDTHHLIKCQLADRSAKRTLPTVLSSSLSSINNRVDPLWSGLRWQLISSPSRTRGSSRSSSSSSWRNLRPLWRCVVTVLSFAFPHVSSCVCVSACVCVLVFAHISGSLIASECREQRPAKCQLWELIGSAIGWQIAETPSYHSWSTWGDAEALG